MQRIMCDGGFLEIQNSLTKGNQFGSDSLGLSGLKPFDGSSHPTVLSDHRACRTGSHESLRKVTRVLLPLQSAHEAAGAAGIRHSPRPQRGGRFINASGASRREGEGVSGISRHCERSEAIHSFYVARWIASLRVRRETGKE